MLAALLTLLPSVKLPLTLCILIGAGLFSYLALKLLDLSKKRLKMSPDSALSFVLTLFFGLGITVASLLQNTYSLLYKQALVFLFGQAATITDPYMYLSISLAVLVVSVILFFIERFKLQISTLFSLKR